MGSRGANPFWFHVLSSTLSHLIALALALLVYLLFLLWRDYVALLLSSYFVINSMGVIDEAAIDRLYLMTELSKTIQVSAAPADDNKAELAPFFPPLLWLLRDFVLDLTADGKTISEQEYMEAAISARSTNQRRAADTWIVFDNSVMR